MRNYKRIEKLGLSGYFKSSFYKFYSISNRWDTVYKRVSDCLTCFMLVGKPMCFVDCMSCCTYMRDVCMIQREVCNIYYTVGKTRHPFIFIFTITLLNLVLLLSYYVNVVQSNNTFSLLHAKLSGAVYCYRSCLCVFVRLFVGLLPW